ncbi:sulfatase-like hydrolase/transferase [Mucilaginibacter sp. RS28]|uniref:Sulfatase-like hydrolase/transferase n=1 Tax=Mucilaginibacter straminoryzae TaxID=2932774 RepID=A0A9X2BAX1_9SPHI|nr:alkaline phosphatase family protein [Mucilaginibacter straminoryzae]MCJ8211215.1 sulfatase-like hydrolase/transferase [Mucilaginibacter straminoryzae]
MLRSFLSFCRYFVYWLVIFFLSRLIFELYFNYKLKAASAEEIAMTFIHGLWLDYSAAAYICIIPLLVFIVSWFVPGSKIASAWLKGYTWFCLLIISFLTIVDLNIFREWGTKVNYRVFNTLFTAPSEAVASTGSSPIGLSLGIGVGLMAAGIALSFLIIDFNFKKPANNLLFKIPTSLLLCLVTFIIIRGGLRGAPISEQKVYFSDKQILNMSVLNTEWNLIHNVVENMRHAYNPYEFMPYQKAADLTADNYKVAKDTTIKLLTTGRPNIVIIQLESFTADIIESLGGDKGVAPYFEQLIRDGVLFDHIYATGDRTDKGMVAIFSGFPSQAIRTIITEDRKQRKLPSIADLLKPAGYSTSYFYGGETDYMNFRSYIANHHIDTIVDERNFSKSEIGSKWGAYDDVMLNKNIGFLDHQKRPFFSYVQTLSNHEPFELRGRPQFPGKDMGNMFRSTAFFTDSSLNAYFTQAKQANWYKNTLFILIADHGHRLPRNTSEAYDPRKYHIPMLFFGDVIKSEYRGKRIEKLGSQTDLAATLLAQLYLPHQQFKWSKDLLNPYSKPFAFFDWDNGFGFMEPHQAVSYDNEGDKIIYRQNKSLTDKESDQTLRKGQAYLQKIYTEYLSY